MILELYNRLDEPQRLDCRRVLFRDRFGQPFCVVIEQEPGKYWIKHLGDNDFREALRAMGVQGTRIVDKYKDGPGGLVLPGP